MIKQSFCYPCFKPSDMSFDELCQRAAQIGYTATELWFRQDEFKELVTAAHKNGLTVASMCGHKSIEVGLNRRDQHDRIEAELRESIQVASDNQIPNLICFSGNCNDGQTSEDALQACAEGLSRVKDLAEKHEINLNMELLNSKVNHPGYQCNNTAWGIELCKRVNSPRVKLLYDIYHMQIMEGHIIQTITDHWQYFGHYHTAGNPGRKDMDDQQELNYPAICRAIKASGYNGFVGHEFTPKADQMEALETAYKTCDV